MRRLALILATAISIATLASCNGLGNNPGPTQQIVKVVRGDLTVNVSGSGNLEVINSRRLSFGSPGKLEKVYVSEGQRVAKGDRIASLATDTLELAISQAQTALVQAQAGLVNAEVGVKAAQQSLDAALGRPTYVEVETAKTDVDEAKSYVQYVTSTMASVSPLEQQMWANALIYAQSRLATAQARLDALLTNSDTEEVVLKRLQVDAAMKSRDVATRSLAYAQEVLDQAYRQLDDATIVAPFDGLLARLNVKENDTVSPAIVAAEIIDPSELQLKVQVDEIDVVDVRLGQEARIEVDALPELTLTGSVDSIALLPTPQSGVVVYDARIRFKATESSVLRAGMSASADIVVAQRQAVLLIPDRAIRKNSAGQTTVLIAIDGKTQEKVVATGISDGIQTEVTAGLQEGDTIVVERSSQSSPGLF